MGLDDQLKKSRQSLLEKLAEIDDDFADLYLNTADSLDIETIESEIRDHCLHRKLSPLLMGSSLRNQGTSDLLDAVIKYLPNPLELKNPVVNELLSSSSGFYGLAFKNVHHKQKGTVSERNHWRRFCQFSVL